MESVRNIAPSVAPRHRPGRNQCLQTWVRDSRAFGRRAVGRHNEFGACTNVLRPMGKVQLSMNVGSLTPSSAAPLMHSIESQSPRSAR